MKILIVTSRNALSEEMSGATIRVKNIENFLDSEFPCEISLTTFPFLKCIKEKYDLIIFHSYTSSYKSLFVLKRKSVFWFDYCDSSTLVNQYYWARNRDLKSVLRIIRDLVSRKLSKQADVYTFITGQDRKMEETKTRIHQSLVFPNMATWKSSEITPTSRKKPRLFFIGDGRYQPNLHSLQWIIDEVLPLIYEANPDLLPLHVIGRGYEGIESESIVKLGYLEKLNESVLSGDINLCASGMYAGMKNKILDGMSLGMWTVCNSASFNGLSLNSRTFIAEKPKEFVLSVSQCLDRSLGSQKENNPIPLIDERRELSNKLKEML